MERGQRRCITVLRHSLAKVRTKNAEKDDCEAVHAHIGHVSPCLAHPPTVQTRSMSVIQFLVARGGRREGGRKEKTSFRSAVREIQLDAIFRLDSVTVVRPSNQGSDIRLYTKYGTMSTMRYQFSFLTHDRPWSPGNS